MQLASHGFDGHRFSPAGTSLLQTTNPISMPSMLDSRPALGGLIQWLSISTPTLHPCHMMTSTLETRSQHRSTCLAHALLMFSDQSTPAERRRIHPLHRHQQQPCAIACVRACLDCACSHACTDTIELMSQTHKHQYCILVITEVGGRDKS